MKRALSPSDVAELLARHELTPEGLRASARTQTREARAALRTRRLACFGELLHRGVPRREIRQILHLSADTVDDWCSLLGLSPCFRRALTEATARRPIRGPAADAAPRRALPVLDAAPAAPAAPTLLPGRGDRRDCALEVACLDRLLASHPTALGAHCPPGCTFFQAPDADHRRRLAMSRGESADRRSSHRARSAA